MENRLKISRLAICLPALLWMAGCSHIPRQATAPAPAAAPSPLNASEPVVRTAVMHAVPELKTVHFAYDSASLSYSARAILRRNAAWLKDHGGLAVQVSGNCDQRGTEEYNLALGQRRAETVRRYYALLGVPADHIATISYGKDQLLCSEMTPACWRENRRAETLAAEPAGVSAGQ